MLCEQMFRSQTLRHWQLLGLWCSTPVIQLKVIYLLCPVWPLQSSCCNYSLTFCSHSSRITSSSELI